MNFNSGSERGKFSSGLGFVLAAAGSAVGLGNIWGFPTQAIENGGGAFLVAYLLLAFLLAYPALIVELVIGRYAGSNIVEALVKVSPHTASRKFAYAVGGISVMTSALLLSFYTIVAGWTLAYFVDALIFSFTESAVSDAITARTTTTSLVFSGVFAILTAAVVARGVKQGIERLSTLLMPALFAILFLLIGYMLIQEGGLDGLRLYLIPDFTRVFDPSLVLDAMGQAFFSMSLGVGTMMIYGSYVSKKENLPRLGVAVTLIDCGIAFLAGLLIIPTLFVAKELGIAITGPDGQFVGGPDMVFQILAPVLKQLGTFSALAAIGFFGLLSIAALTSSVSMLEVPTSLVTEKTKLSRAAAAGITAVVVFVISAFVIVNIDWAFEFVVVLSTQYNIPLLATFFCIFAGWLWNRNTLLQELSLGHPEIQKTLFWKIWPAYVKFVCPVFILSVFAQSVF